MTIRVMTIEDHPAVHALWASLPGIGLHEHEDSPEGMAYYLKRNPESCFVALEGDALIGAVLCGNDGRRGYINHLAVAQEHQGKGLGRALVNACLAAMRNEGIRRCCFVTYRSNDEGNAFWDAVGSVRRDEALYRSIGTEQNL
ncbi:MAG: GNAT family N-acetyltransferase [Firmicutes bacterium]|nr:GNAT family N-acetyltransferase [Bacillota bacterium]